MKKFIKAIEVVILSIEIVTKNWWSKIKAKYRELYARWVLYRYKKLEMTGAVCSIKGHEPDWYPRYEMGTSRTSMQPYCKRCGLEGDEVIDEAIKRLNGGK